MALFHLFCHLGSAARQCANFHLLATNEDRATALHARRRRQRVRVPAKLALHSLQGGGISLAGAVVPFHLGGNPSSSTFFPHLCGVVIPPISMYLRHLHLSRSTYFAAQPPLFCRPQQPFLALVHLSWYLTKNRWRRLPKEVEVLVGAEVWPNVRKFLRLAAPLLPSHCIALTIAGLRGRPAIAFAHRIDYVCA